MIYNIENLNCPPRFASDNYDWEPRLHPYQQIGANVLFFTFINPATMDVPVAFKKLGITQDKECRHQQWLFLAATRCKDTVGAIPCDTRVIFAIGGWDSLIDFNQQWFITLRCFYIPDTLTAWNQIPGNGWRPEKRQRPWLSRWNRFRSEGSLGNRSLIHLTRLGCKMEGWLWHWWHWSGSGGGSGK